MLYDVAVIGGGPAGYTAAERAAANGLKVILFEKNELGGVCLNEGCIPTKTLLYSAKVLDTIKGAKKYGVTVDSEPEFDLSKIIARKKKTVRKLVAGIKQKLENHNVEVVNALASLQSVSDNKIVTISANDTTYTAKHVILCSGSESIIPPIKDLDSVEYWTSKEALDNKEVPTSLTIVGGGVIGIEFASFFNSLGVKVSVVEMFPEILGAMDNELSAMLREEYTKRGVDFYMSTKVLSVDGQKVCVEKDSEQFTIESEKILISTGRRPVSKELNLEALNIAMFRNGVEVNEYMQTSQDMIYACGDLTGESLLAHTAIREVEVAVNHILGKQDAMSYRAIPGVVYTNPEIAGVGETEESMQTKGLEYKVKTLPMAFSGRFVAENEQVNGVCKLILDKGDIVIGCHMLGNPASELIVVAGMAIEKNYTIEEFRKVVFPHPSVGEIFHEILY